MARDRKSALLEGLDHIEGELSTRVGRGGLKHEHAEAPKQEEHVEHEGEPKDSALEKEVEEHLVASGQFDCPHCGGKLKVGSKHE